MPTLSNLAKDERTARQVLSLIGTPNDAATGALLERVGGVELIALVERDTAIPGMDRIEAAIWRDRLQSRANPNQVASRLLTENDYRVLVPEDSEWPAALNDLRERAPYALWAAGRAELLSAQPSQLITITGARAATAYGVHVAEDISSELARNGKTLVAGAAYGIEGSVHRSALIESGNTIAVLASGVDRPYPAGHADLIASVSRQGLVLSELPPGVSPTRQRFLDRSRILAALSGATIVVEAGFRSGTLHTARKAGHLDRIVGAVPGPVTSAASAGTNHLLQEGSARVVTNASDVTRMLDSANAPRRSVIHLGASRAVLPNNRAL